MLPGAVMVALETRLCLAYLTALVYYYQIFVEYCIVFCTCNSR